MTAMTILWACRALASDPARQWYTITTPHFFVHYYRNTRHDAYPLAQRAARAAERAHAVLAPLLRHEPTTRTHVVLTDDSDGANGSATVVPYNVIRIYATAPESRTALEDHDEWVYTLLVHEYTHILHIDTIFGLAKFVNAIMGKIWAPNQVQPRWFIEGLAVYEETRQTSGGRNRSTLYDMYLRAAVLEGKLLDIDQISSQTRYFPQGAVPYLYGGRFIKYLADRYGPDKLADISQAYGGRALPYALNRIARQTFGKGYEALYDDFRTYLARKYALQKQQVEKRGATPFRRVTNRGWNVGSPRYAPDGSTLVYIADDGYSHASIRLLDANTHKEVKTYKQFGGNTVAFTPDGRYLVFGRSVQWRTFYGFHDLFVMNRKDGTERQLTYGRRARDPAVSPDGKRVLFVSNDLAKNDLYVVPFAGGTPRRILHGTINESFFTPRWSPDGQHIVLSQRKNGARDIVVINVETGAVQHITRDRAVDMDPQYSRDGQRIYFSSDRTGIFNIYCHDLATATLSQVTNVLGGAFAPAVSPDESQMYYVGFSAAGYDLHQMALDRNKFLSTLPYVDTRPSPATIPTQTATATFPVSSYSPWRTLYPRSWSFNIGSDAFGTSIGIDLTGEDVVGRHSYNVSTNVSANEGHVSYALSYAYTRFWPSIVLNTSRFVSQRGDAEIDGVPASYLEENYGLGVSVGLPVLRMPDHSATVTVGHHVNWFRDAQGLKAPVSPDMSSPTLPESGRLSGVSLSLSYDNYERYSESISIERGRRLGVSLRMDNDAFVSNFNSTSVRWHWNEYIDIPWLDRHVFALGYSGGIAHSDLANRGYFSIGGFPEQDVLRALIDVMPLGGSYLRGYDPGSLVGDQFHLLDAEYRFPLFSLESGFATLPFYINRAYASVFCDVGNAFFGTFSFDDFKVGVGGEILTEWIIGYVLPFTLRVGYARGLMDSGGNQFFFLLGNTF